MYPDHQETLKGLKRLELQPAIRGQIIFWSAVLTMPLDPKTRHDAMLGFGTLKTYDINAGVNDRAWLKREEGEKAKEVESAIEESEDMQ